MKFTSVLAILASASVALAQSVSIALPTQGQTLQRGSQAVVRVQRPNFSSSVAEIGVGISIGPCFTTPCENAGLGPVLFTGSFSPAPDPANPQQAPFQDYTITVPDLGAGNAVLYVAHASIVGANGFFLAELVNQTVVLA